MKSSFLPLPLPLSLFLLSSPPYTTLAKPQRGVSTPRKSSRKNDSYSILARAIQPRVNEPIDSNYDIDSIASALKSLSKAQAALKKIDGTAHEMYQRTHKSSTNLANDQGENFQEGEGSSSNKLGSLKVAGRMSRKAARLGCIADALFTAELCELLNLASVESAATENEEVNVFNDEEGTLASWTERRIVLKTTISSEASKSGNYPSISLLVIYEPGYIGGAGRNHGGVDDLLRFSKYDLIKDEDSNATKQEVQYEPRGRYLIILSDGAASNTDSVDDLSSIVRILDKKPCRVKMCTSIPGETASVCEPLYYLAGRVVDAIEPIIRGGLNVTSDASDSDPEPISSKADVMQDRKPAIHIVGHSLAGGVAALAALILDGTIPPPVANKKGSNKEENEQSSSSHSGLKPIAKERSSAFCLGPPPCLSPNLKAPFITSIIHGDDIICRTSQAALKHLCERTQNSIKGGMLGRSVGWMTDAVSLTVSGLKSQSKKTKEDKLIVPGKVFLIRPRRMGGGSSSIHEVGDGAAGVRESLRAAVLWQLNDILLSGSMLMHHGLDSYIRSLDRVKLSGLADESPVLK